ncbi:MAG: putative glycolipid-binding domain-containing protein [Acidobacteriota bacterium]|jgi:hypothetical protein
MATFEGAPVRPIGWKRTDRPGLEVLTVERRDEALAIESDLLVVLGGEVREVEYELSYDSRWRFLGGEIRSTEGATTRELHLVRDEGGEWRVDDEARPDLAGCSDLDVMVTPFTNTPPLWRLDLAPGEARAFRVAWVRFPELTVTPVRQEYARLGENDPPTRFLYRNLDSGFEDELAVDEHRLVVVYGPWRRIRRRVPGRLKGRLHTDPGFDDPLPEEIERAFRGETE